MKQYQKLFIGLSLLTFISCGSSGGGGHDSSTNVTLVNGEVLAKGKTSTTPIVTGTGETQTSNGNLSITDTSSTAMTASGGGQVTNGADGTVSGVFAVGMGANGAGSKVTNEGGIIGGTVGNTSRSVVSNSDEEIERIGMKVTNGAEAINNGQISGELSEGILADGAGSTATNNGSISSTGVEWTETYTEDGIEYNETGTWARGMKAIDGSSVINGEDGIISGTISEGMRAEGPDSTAVNYGNISSTGTEYNVTYMKDGIEYNETETGATGMKAQDGASVTNGETGVISGTIGVGMRAKGTNSIATNNGEISSIGSEYTETSIENGEEDIYSETYAIGMKAYDGGSVINNGTISGTISEGMIAKGTGSKAENHGTISVNGNSGYGMAAYEGATAINGEAGIINLNGTGGTGMYATGDGSTIENRGTIYLSGSEVISSSNEQTAEEIALNDEIFNGKDNKGNIGMKIKNGARMINKGQITFGE